MWGNLILETYSHTLFNTGFNNQKSTNLVYLLKWQYFWWFWFSYLFVLYYNILFNMILTQTLKFNLKIPTTLKAHGKWGDVIICLLPVFWCVNILTNSNALLKSIEWQTETNCLVLRVRGKQWYWSYKFNTNSVYTIMGRPRVIGSGNPKYRSGWKGLLYQNTLQKNQFWNKHDKLPFRKKIDYTDNCLIFYNNFNFNKYTWLHTLKTYTKNVNLQFFKTNRTFMTGFYHQKNLTTAVVKPTKTNEFFELINDNYYGPFFNVFNNNQKINNKMFSFFFKDSWEFTYIEHLLGKNCRDTNKYFDMVLSYSYPTTNQFIFPQKKLITSLDHTPQLIIKKLQTTPLLKTKQIGFYKTNTFAKQKLVLVKNCNTQQKLLNFTHTTNKKPIYQRAYITLKQEILKNKRKLDKSSFFATQYYNHNKQFYNKLYENKRMFYNLINNRRLLNTKTLIVLPVNTNITLITNSFDVVHSWFIPGLGLKMDCVPGRSTHHSLNVRTPGFYYGQCAEICGRLHHHMPIKVCFVPYKLFCVWWNYFILKNQNK